MAFFHYIDFAPIDPNPPRPRSTTTAAASSATQATTPPSTAQDTIRPTGTHRDLPGTYQYQGFSLNTNGIPRALYTLEGAGTYYLNPARLPEGQLPDSITVDHQGVRATYNDGTVVAIAGRQQRRP